MDKNKSDHILSIIKAGISGIPVVGGPIASLISDYIPSSTQIVIESTLKLLSEKINQISNRIDTQNLDKEEFAELFKSTYLIIIRSHKKMKIKAAVNLLTNILLNKSDSEKLTYNELDHFSRVLDQLSIGALEIIAKIAKHFNDRFKGNLFEISMHGNEERRIDFKNINKLQPNLDPSLLMGLISELNSHNLLHIVGIPQIRTYNFANYPIELTTLGIRFVRTLLKEELDH